MIETHRVAFELWLACVSASIDRSIRPSVYHYSVWFGLVWFVRIKISWPAARLLLLPSIESTIRAQVAKGRKESETSSARVRVARVRSSFFSFFFRVVILACTIYTSCIYLFYIYISCLYYASFLYALSAIPSPICACTIPASHCKTPSSRTILYPCLPLAARSSH